MLFGHLLFKVLKLNLIILIGVLSVFGFLMLFPSFREDIRIAVYNSLITIGTPILSAHLDQVNIPDQVGNISTGLGILYYGVTNISLTKVNIQKSYASFRKDEVTLSFCNVSIGGYLDWHYQLGNSSILQSKGKADADFLEINMVAGLSLISKNGTLELHYTQCRFEIEKLIIKFHVSTLSPLLNVFRHKLSEILKDFLNDKTCGQIKSAITKEANSRLKDIPLGTRIGDAVKIFIELFSDSEVAQPPVSCQIPHRHSDIPRYKGCNTTSKTNTAIETIACKEGESGCNKQMYRPRVYF